MHEDTHHYVKSGRQTVNVRSVLVSDGRSGDDDDINDQKEEEVQNEQ